MANARLRLQDTVLVLVVFQLCLFMESRIDTYAARIHVRNLDDSVFDESMINNLVLAESRIKTLKSLAKSFIRENVHEQAIEGDPWTADFVRGKGNGLIFLLHGSPGVGKTYTAGMRKLFPLSHFLAFCSRHCHVLTVMNDDQKPYRTTLEDLS